MRCWSGAWVIAGIAGTVVLAACGTSTGGTAAASASDSASARPPSTTPAPDASTSPRESPTTTTPPAGDCAAGCTTVSVAPGAEVQRRLCVRPGTTVSLVLRPRADDKRWTAVRSSAPAVVQVSGWRLDTDGTAHASLRCAGTAEITALAKAPDVAGAARGAFTLHVSVTR